jgi:Photosynthetic reaction centre cytochrome C subunit
MRTFTRLSVLALALVLGLVAQGPPGGGPPGGGKKGGGAPKNLKVLTAETFRPLMATYTAALGVQCTHCHVAGAFDSDENPKKAIARNMITMVKEINAKFPDGKEHVSCFTCHQGALEPKIAPAQ